MIIGFNHAVLRLRHVALFRSRQQPTAFPSTASAPQHIGFSSGSVPYLWDKGRPGRITRALLMLPHHQYGLCTEHVGQLHLKPAS